MMKRILLFILWIILPFSGFCQQEMNMQLLSRWDDDSIPQAWTGAYSECWGYAAEGKEYAFLASTQGTYFFNITDPANPQLIDFIRTKDTTTLVVNKDYATYQHYLYAVSDQGDNSLQIFDLQYLPDSVVKVYDSNAISKRCHTLSVDHDRLYMNSNTRPDNTIHQMDVYSIVNPTSPVFLGTLSNPGFDKVHESFVRNDTAYCSNGYNGLWIYDFHNATTPVLLSIIDNYTEVGFNHTSWLSDDSKTMVFTDENHGKGVKLFNINDITDPQLLSITRSNLLQVPDPLTDNGSVAHQPYIVGNTLLVSYYHDGVQAFDISDPTNPVITGYYDTYPENTNYYSYKGCWGLYPFLPSGNIIASDILNGLFILDGSKVLNVPPIPPKSTSFQSWFSDENWNVSFTSPVIQEIKIDLFDITGKLIVSKSLQATSYHQTFPIKVSSLSKGVYVSRITFGNETLALKIVKAF